MKYPSVKNNKLGILAVIVLIVVVFLFFTQKSNSGTLIFEKNEDASDKAAQLLAVSDSDNDGLRDWEEALWKTDKNNPDSDNDGTKDGEEVRVGRDPSKPAPDDLFASATDVKMENVSGEDYVPPDTVTDALIEDFLEQYFELKKNTTGELTEESKYSFINSVVNNISFQGAKKPMEHKIGELQILPEILENNASLNSLREYGNELAQVFVNAIKNGSENELDIINEAFAEGQDRDKAEKFVERLMPITSNYKNIIDELLRMKVPDSIANIHLEMINEYEKINASLLNISLFFTDTILAITGISSYTHSTNKINVLGIELTDVFSKKGIVFEKEEIGSLFFNKK